MLIFMLECMCSGFFPASFNSRFVYYKSVGCLCVFIRHKKHEVVVLSDAATHETYHRDPYIAQYRPKSVLCVPIVLHGEFINAVYLENNGFEGSFTAGRNNLEKKIQR